MLVGAVSRYCHFWYRLFGPQQPWQIFVRCVLANTLQYHDTVNFVQDSETEDPQPAFLDGSAKNGVSGSALRTKAISLRVASATVSTLSPCDECADGPTFSVTGSILALQSHFAQRGLQVVGIQKGRRRTSALRVCPEYSCTVSPASANGCLGCELWVSTSIPWNDSSGGATSFFKPTDFQVMFANERMIGVAAR